MQIIWQKFPIAANGIINELSGITWTGETIRTFVNRLSTKKLVSHEKKGKEYWYKPVISEDEYVRWEITEFVKRTGIIGLKCLLQEVELSNSEITMMQRILHES